MRMVVDLPAPLAPRKPKISPCFTENDRSFTATKRPNRRDRLADVDRGVAHGQRPSARSRRASASRTLASARVRASCDSSSCTCATSTSVLVATPAAKRSPMTRRDSGGAAHRVGRGADAWPGSNRDPAAAAAPRPTRCVSNSARRSRARLTAAAASATCALVRPQSNEGPVHVDADVPRALPACPGAERCFGFGLA